MKISPSAGWPRSVVALFLICSGLLIAWPAPCEAKDKKSNDTWKSGIRYPVKSTGLRAIRYEHKSLTLTVERSNVSLDREAVTVYGDRKKTLLCLHDAYYCWSWKLYLCEIGGNKRGRQAPRSFWKVERDWCPADKYPNIDPKCEERGGILAKTKTKRTYQSACILSAFCEATTYTTIEYRQCRRVACYSS